MSVLYCRIPHFLAALTRAHVDLPATQPLALLGPDERVWGVSPAAARAGVAVQMRPPLAQARCPDLCLLPLDTARADAAQQAFGEVLGAWQLPTEMQSWGAAYIDLHGVAAGAPAVQPLAAELGQQLRRVLGAHLQPAIGWDSGKFTARAAAVRARPGCMRLVGKAEEVPFLSPLPITLLPLETAALQQLNWLGIRTLGQFAHLPAVAVQQRFGAAGRLAQAWAQGRDTRPVHDAAGRPFPPRSIDFDAPTTQLGAVMAALMHVLDPLLQDCLARLEGCTRVQLQLTFVTGETRRVELALVEPLADGAILRARLQDRLQTLVWPGALDRITVTHFAAGELPAPQLTLFRHPELEEPAPSLEPLAHGLARRFGPVFWRGELVDEAHPLPEKRTRLHELP